jgi:hypothetical protein
VLPGNHSGLSLGLTATAFTTIDPLAAPDATLDCRRARPERNDPFTDPPLLTTLCALVEGTAATAATPEDTQTADAIAAPTQKDWNRA